MPNDECGDSPLHEPSAQDEPGSASNPTDATEFFLPLADSGSDQQYLRATHAIIASQRSRTENFIAKLLVWAIVLSLPALLVVVWLLPDTSEQFQSLFDRWITLVGPLAGAAVGFGAMRNVKG